MTGCEKACVVCNVNSDKLCSACHKVSYCSTNHQKNDWKRHKAECYPGEIKRDDTFGRHLIATRDIKVGEIIYKDNALVSAPISQFFRSNEVCLGCYNVICKDGEKCETCFWPVCSQSCAKVKGHKNYECKIFCEHKVDNSNGHNCPFHIAALRTLLCKRVDYPKWKILNSLMSHSKVGRVSGEELIDPFSLILALITHDCTFHYKTLLERRDIGVALAKQGKALTSMKRAGRSQSTLATAQLKRCVKFIRETCKLKEFDEHEIDHAIGIWLVNAFGTDCANDTGGDVKMATILFEKLWLPSHSCSPNTKGILNYKGNGEFFMQLRAAVKIPKGSQIHTSYVDPTLGSPERQQILSSQYHFQCSCARCHDVTEFDTHFSAILCPTCRNGWLLPQDGVDCVNSLWICDNNSCHSQAEGIPYKMLKPVVTKFKSSIDSLDSVSGCGTQLTKRIENLENLLDSASLQFHKNHWLVCKIRQRLAQTTAASIDGMQSGSETEKMYISKAIDHAEHCLRVADGIFPGQNLYRGQLLYYLGQAKLHELWNRLMVCKTTKKAKKSTASSVQQLKTEVNELLKSLERVVEECAIILLQEPDDSSDSRVAIKVKEKFANILQMCQTL